MFRPLKIRHYVRAMLSRGFKPEQVLAASGIRESDLHDPAFLVSLAQCRKVVSSMISLTGNQALGFEIGNDADFRDLGVIGYALLSARSVRDAIHLWMRYSSSLLGMLVEFRMSENGDGAYTLTFTEKTPSGFLYNFCVEELLMLTHHLGGLLCEEKTVVQKLELAYPEPSHAALYAAYLHCKPSFNARETAITYVSPRLDASVRGSDAEFNALCQQHCTQVMRQIASHSDVIARLHSLLLARPGAVPDLESTAMQLAMSSRTLRRRLAEQGQTYGQVVNQFRLDLARDYLASGQITAKEVGYLLGYTDADAFRRAFKKWSGETVQQYRRSAMKQAAAAQAESAATS